MQTRELEQLLRAHGFAKVREGKKHDLWEKGAVRIPVARHSSVENFRIERCVRSLLRRLASGELTGQPYIQGRSRGEKT